MNDKICSLTYIAPPLCLRRGCGAQGPRTSRATHRVGYLHALKADMMVRLNVAHGTETKKK